jgi:putative cell wall-binding protein
MRRIVVALALMVGLMVPIAAGGAELGYADAARIDATSPRTAAILISRQLYADDAAGAVVLAREDTFPDALGAAALTADLDAPLLLTPRDSLPADVEKEIRRLLPEGGSVYLLGGEAALSTTLERQLDDLGFRTPRFPGRDRIETAAMIARFVGAAGGRAILVRSAGTPDLEVGWVDSVSCGAFAAKTGIPVLLTTSGGATVADETLSTLRSLGVQRVDVCGGTAAVPESQASQLRDLGLAVHRHSGADRAATAVAVAQGLWGATTRADRRYVIAPGFGATFGYGLVAAPLAAVLDAPLLLVGTDFPTACDEPPAGSTLCYLEAAGTGNAAGVVAIGARAVIADPVLGAVAEAANLAKDTTAPPVPQNLKLTDPPEDDGRTIEVTWTKVDDPGPVTYTVYWRPTDDEGALSRTNSTGAKTTATAMTLRVPTAGISYDVAVDATDEFGNRSALSAVVSIAPVDEVPAAPPSGSGPGAVKQGDDVLLTWVPNTEADVAGYVIERTEQPLLANNCTNGVFPPNWNTAQRTDVVGRNASSHVDAGATSGNWCYRYRVYDDSAPRNETAPSGVTEYDG